jgi:hypothetical protein
VGASFWHGGSYGCVKKMMGGPTSARAAGARPYRARGSSRFSPTTCVVAFAFCGANWMGITIRIDHLRSVAAAARRSGNSDAYYDYLGLATTFTMPSFYSAWERWPLLACYSR